VRLAVSTFTVVPVAAVPAASIDRTVAGLAMAIAPGFGAALGAIQAGVAVGMQRLVAPPLVTGTVAVATGLLLTRGLHLDGLADTIDGLGAYTSRPRALEIMKAPGVGPFAVAAVVLDLVGQAAAIGALSSRAWLTVVCAMTAVGAAGRLAAGYGCRRGVAAARPDGMGALVAGTVGRPALLAGGLGVLLLAWPAVPGRPLQGPVSMLVALVVAAVVGGHAVRRFGGVTGDVLGALVEIATTIALVGLVLGGTSR
jgi:adenosylcobinamide-GDP ribazoletransferase